MVEKKLEIEIVRIKPIPNGYSILAKCEGMQRGFSYGFNQNKHQKDSNGEPLYIEDIRKQFRVVLDNQENDLKYFAEIEKEQGKSFKQK